MCYKQIEREFYQGDIVKKSNGKQYRIMEKYTERDFLLLDSESGNFCVASGVKYYASYPDGEGIASENPVYCIEWEHGAYYGPTPSEIDFKAIRNKYTDSIEPGYYRLSEIATLLKDGLIEDDEYEAKVYMKETCEFTDSEAEYFGVDFSDLEEEDD